MTARRMSDLKVVAPAEELIAPTQVTEAARATQAPELMDQRVVALAKPRISPGQTDLLNELRDASGEA